MGTKITQADVDLSLAQKVYVDVNLFRLKTDSHHEVTSILKEQGSVVWMLPIYANGKTAVFQISKGLPVPPNASLSEEERKRIEANVGKWTIPAFGSEEGKTDYYARVKAAFGHVPQGTLLVSGQPYFRIPMALIPGDSGELAWIIPSAPISYEEPELPTVNMNGIDVYPYHETKEIIDQYDTSDAEPQGSPLLIPLSILITLSIALIGFMILRRKTKRTA